MKGEEGPIGLQGNKGDAGTNGRNSSIGLPGIDVCACIYMYHSPFNNYRVFLLCLVPKECWVNQEEKDY